MNPHMKDSTHSTVYIRVLKEPSWIYVFTELVAMHSEIAFPIKDTCNATMNLAKMRYLRMQNCAVSDALQFCP